MLVVPTIIISLKYATIIILDIFCAFISYLFDFDIVIYYQTQFELFRSVFKIIY